MEINANNYLVNGQLDLQQIPREHIRGVEESCVNLARMDRLKAAGFMILSGTAAIGDKVLMPMAVAIIAFEIAEIAASILFLPLIIIYPLYSLTTSLVAIGGGLAAFGLYIGHRDLLVPNVKNYSDEFFKKALTSWNSASQWDAEVKRISLIEF